MKAAFYIPVQRQSGRPLKLLVEAGQNSLSFLWYHCEPKELAGLAIYHLGHPLDMSQWKSLMQSESHLQEPVEQVIISYDGRESTLVPASYFLPETAADILHELFGRETHTEIRQTYIENLPAYLIYRLPSGLHDQILGTFPGALITHSTREQILNYSEKAVELHAIFQTQTIKVCLFRNGDLQFVQYLAYQTAADACYHLLNTCHRYAIKPEEIRLQLSGMIEKGSPLFTEIYSCFANMELSKVSDSWIIPESAAELPGHYFSHLTELVSCVS